MDYENVYVFGGVYDSRDAAKDDYAQLDRMYDDGVIGPFQAAIVEKRADGKVKVLHTSSTTRAEGAAVGGAIGAMLGLIFPPAVPLTAAGGAAIGAATGNAEKGWTKGDVKRLADDELLAGETGIIVVAEAGPALDAAAVLAAARVTEAELVAAEHRAMYRDLLESDGVVAVSTH